MSEFWRYFRVILLGAAIGVVIGGIIALICKGTGKNEINTVFLTGIGRNQILSVDQPVELRLEYCGTTNFVFRDEANQLVIGEQISESQLPLSLTGPCWEKRISGFKGNLLLVQAGSGTSILVSIKSAEIPVTLRIYYPQYVILNIFRLWSVVFGAIAIIVGLLIVRFG